MTVARRPALLSAAAVCLCLLIIQLWLLSTVQSASLTTEAHAPTEEEFEWPDLKLIRVTDGLSMPVGINHAGDGGDRLFIVEQTGRIRIISDETLIEKPFLNISDRISCCHERGLLGLAFSPTYSETGRFYVNYTNAAGHTIISRFQISDDPDVADPDSEQIVLTITQPTHVHNGGQLAFGTHDDYLYISVGDGGRRVRAQEPDSLLGKILRIDVETNDPLTYTIPSSNPFTQTQGYRGEIWALGLRNPWRFSFDQNNGDLYIADVGENRWEEINYQPATSSGGENYGWPILEGLACFGATECDTTGLTMPIFVYGRALGCSVTGGKVYRGGQYKRMQGIYFYGDYCSGRIWGLRYAEATEEWVNHFMIRAPFRITSFGEDEAGELYVTDYWRGAIYRIEDIEPDPVIYTHFAFIQSFLMAGE